MPKAMPKVQLRAGLRLALVWLGLVAGSAVWSQNLPPQLSKYSLGDEASIPPTPLRKLPKDAGGVAVQPDCTPLPAGGTLSLLTAVQHALCNSPQTRTAWATALGQAAALGIARSAYLPTANLALASVRQESNLAPDLTADTKNLTLNYVLYDFGLRQANLDAAKEGLGAALASQDAALQTVFIAAAGAFYSAITARSALQATQDAEKAAQESWNAASAKFKQGAGTPTDVMQARSAVSKAALQRINAEGATEASRGTLAAAMGLPPQTPLQLPVDLASEELAQTSAAFLQKLDGLLAQAQLSHPTIVSAQAQLRAAQAKVASTEAEGRPNITLSAARYLNGRPSTPLLNTNSQETTYSVTLNVPLFEGFGRGAKVNAAQAQVEGKAAELANAQLQVALEIWKAHQELQSQASALDASQDLLTSTDQAYKATQARYRVGAAGIVDVLTTQSAQAAALQQKVETVGKWRAAQLKLLGSVGQLGNWALGN